MSRRPVRTAGLAALLAVALAVPATAARDDLTYASRASDGTPGDALSFQPAISGDGRFVVFHSDARTLSADDGDAVRDVILRDLATGTTTLVSRAAGAAGAAGDAESENAAIGADGRRVAFASDADNLSAQDDDAVRDVFVRDVVLGTTALVSRADGAAGVGGDAISSLPSVSADGRKVAFYSEADNLSSEDDDAVADIYVRDVIDGTTLLVSRATGLAGAGANGGSFSSEISDDGRFVAFDSVAPNLSGEDADPGNDVFVRDLVANTTTLVSRATGAGGAAGDKGSIDPSISADGRYVAFASIADNLSADDRDPGQDIFVRDLVAGTTTLVSRATGADGTGGDGTSLSPSISADGRYVTFTSRADNLSPDDRDDSDDVFVRDLVANTTTLVSRAAGPAGAGADASSSGPAISADGLHVAFASAAGNLSAEDADPVADVFVRDLSPATGAGQGPGGGGGVGQGPGPVVSVRCAGLRATIVGTARRDVLRGTPRRDVIAALGGNDRVLGLGGNDVICLGAGADRASGGAGADRILGGAGADRIAGGAGRDVLLGGAGRDLLLGGAGRDRLVGGAGRDRVLGGTSTP